jgi:hypothetical protein
MRMNSSIEELINLYNEQVEQKKYLSEFEAERLLWFKVILRAIYDFVLYKNSKTPSLKRYGERASKWLFKNYTKNPPFQSFQNICQELDLSTEAIRRLAEKLPRSKIIKIEFLGRNKKHDN